MGEKTTDSESQEAQEFLNIPATRSSTANLAPYPLHPSSHDDPSPSCRDAVGVDALLQSSMLIMAPASIPDITMKLGFPRSSQGHVLSPSTEKSDAEPLSNNHSESLPLLNIEEIGLDGEGLDVPVSGQADSEVSSGVFDIDQHGKLVADELFRGWNLKHKTPGFHVKSDQLGMPSEQTLQRGIVASWDPTRSDQSLDRIMAGSEEDSNEHCWQKNNKKYGQMECPLAGSRQKNPNLCPSGKDEFDKQLPALDEGGHHSWPLAAHCTPPFKKLKEHQLGTSIVHGPVNFPDFSGKGEVYLAMITTAVSQCLLVPGSQ
ncbi:unnamed protein product [Sphagnum balticum]